MRATEEQIAICQSTAQTLKIKAGAGTGKTTTLRGFAGRHRNERILYLAFNKAIKEDAQGKFVPNVRAMTAHGLAYAQVGKHYGNAPNKLAPDLKPFHVLPYLASALKSVPGGLHNLYGGRVVDTIKAFLISPDDAMGEEHVIVGDSPGERKYFAADQILTNAQSIWTRMQDVQSDTPMLHDGYLKMFALTKPNLGYDIILLDEAQDTNPVTQGLVGDQACRRVYVGDEHQAIYGFRGARNAMALIQADEDHMLTGSFRFGPEVAHIANMLLMSKGEEQLRIRGLGPSSTIGPLGSSGMRALVARGNAALFARAVLALERRETFAFVGALGNYRLDLIAQTYGLSAAQNVRDPFLQAFKTFDELEEYAETMNDREWMGRCRLVTTYGKRLPALVAQIQSQAQAYPGPDVQVVLTSAHRSKGLEFEQVQMADDFMDFWDDEAGTWRDLSNMDIHTQEEINLQYVAVTRAKARLELGPKIVRWRSKIPPPPKTPRGDRERPIDAPHRPTGRARAGRGEQTAW